MKTITHERTGSILSGGFRLRLWAGEARSRRVRGVANQSLSYNPHPSTALDMSNLRGRVGYRSAQDATPRKYKRGSTLSGGIRLRLWAGEARSRRVRGVANQSLSHNPHPSTALDMSNLRGRVGYRSAQDATPRKYKRGSTLSGGIRLRLWAGEARSRRVRGGTQ
ncbi:MAG TPA: hypothetical protein PK530_00810 [Anaerolineales bacterium]|nr:hypothetical protein [Anaerolineales bacterium]